jgi:transcriptional regulator with XRE-family HTH domain
MREMRTLSKRVRKLRRDKNLTKAALAQRSGLSVDTIRRIEGAGVTLYNPHLDTLAYVAQALDVKVGELTNKPVERFPIFGLGLGL